MINQNQMKDRARSMLKNFLTSVTFFITLICAFLYWDRTVDTTAFQSMVQLQTEVTGLRFLLSAFVYPFLHLPEGHFGVNLSIFLPLAFWIEMRTGRLKFLGLFLIHQIGISLLWNLAALPEWQYAPVIGIGLSSFICAMMVHEGFIRKAPLLHFAAFFVIASGLIQEHVSLPTLLGHLAGLLMGFTTGLLARLPVVLNVLGHPPLKVDSPSPRARK